MLVHTDVN